MLGIILDAFSLDFMATWIVKRFPLGWVWVATLLSLHLKPS